MEGLCYHFQQNRGSGAEDYVNTLNRLFIQPKPHSDGTIYMSLMATKGRDDSEHQGPVDAHGLIRERCLGSDPTVSRRCLVMLVTTNFIPTVIQQTVISKDECRSKQNVKTLKFNSLRQLLFYAMFGTTVYKLFPQLKLKWPKNEAVMYMRRHSLKGSEQNLLYQCFNACLVF